jgi:hypothetical protein
MAGYYGAGQVKAYYTIYGRCLLEAKLKGNFPLSIISGK